jgi:sulfate adenylyltransferase subunit 2
MTKLLSSVGAIKRVADKTDSVILFDSTGKDSLVTLDLIYPYFKRIVCVFMYFVKGLEHVDRYLRWTKARYPKVEIVQIPHWNLTYVLRGGLYCVPDPKMKLLKLKDIVYAMRLRFGIHYVFLGMKKADSMNRRLMLMTYQNCENNGLVYPLSEWTQKDILAYMRQNNLPQPIRYNPDKPSSGVGLNLDCFLWMRKNAPLDLQKVLKTFPMSERILDEYDYQQGKEKTNK